MAETGSGGSGTSSPPPKEMSMEVRLLLAFLLMGAVMFVTPYIFKTTTPPASKKTQAPVAANAQKSSEAAASASPAATPAAAVESKAAVAPASSEPAGPATPQKVAPPFVIDTNLFRVAFTNHGADVESWQLKKYKGNDGKPLELTNTATDIGRPFSFYFPGAKPTSDVNWTYYVQTPDPDGLGVTYTYSDGHTTVRKAFRFQKNSYLSQISTEVTVDGKPLPSMIQWRGGFGDLTIPSPSSAEHGLYFDQPENKLVEQKPKAGTITAGGDFAFAGLSDAYFSAVLLPDSNTHMQMVTFADSLRTPLEEKPTPLIGVAVSDGSANHFRLFVGPKDVNLLKSIDPKLEQVVDFGRWLGWLAKPLFLIVNWSNSSFIHNFGWSIVAVTVAINFILFPLKLSNMKSMRKMQALKPQIDTINAKYKNVGLRDPKKADQNQEVMDLYKRHGVNPMGGCFPMLIQVPFFIAFYTVFRVSVEMRGASWLWVSDLAQAEPGPIKFLPIIMIASQFLMQQMTPQPTTDPNQAKMMKLMPLIFGFMFYQFPSGLVLYYLTSNLVGMAQQWFFNHTESAQEAARSVEPPKKKNGRK
jgi:YidC/Oxa1 family membrane protein insertase